MPLLLSLGYATAWLPVLKQASAEAPALPTNARRVVSMAPALTEIVYALQQGNRLVGRSDFCSHPPAARRLPMVGGYFDPRVEEILRLRPDLLLIYDRQTWLARRSRQLGVPCLPVDLRQVNGVLAAIRRVGAALGDPANGRRVASALQANLQRQCAASQRQAAGQRVLWIMSRRPGSLSGMLGMGPAGHRQELLLLAGYQNALQSQPLESPTVSREMVLSLRPDIILDDLSYHPGTAEQRRARARRVWQPLLQSPGRRIRLCLLTDGVINLPGPRLAQGLSNVLKLLGESR